MYYFFLSAGGISAILYFLISLKIRNIKYKYTVFILGIVSLILGLAFAFLTGLFSHKSGHFNIKYSDFEYYLTAVVFLTAFYFSLKILKSETSIFNTAGESLIVFSFIARFGCMFAGCCAGKIINGFEIPTVIMEIIFSFVIFWILKLSKLKNTAGLYLFLYSVYRFVTEFLRENSEIRTIFSLNFRQYVALIVILYFILCFIFGILERRTKNIEKI